MTTITAAPKTAPKTTLAPARRRFTVAEYYAMADAGILTRDDRVELLDGDIIHMTPIGDWHSAKVIRFNYLLLSPLEGRAVVSIQGPTHLSDVSEPQPDVMLLKWRDDLYEGGTSPSVRRAAPHRSFRHHRRLRPHPKAISLRPRRHPRSVDSLPPDRRIEAYTNPRKARTPAFGMPAQPKPSPPRPSPTLLWMLVNSSRNPSPPKPTAKPPALPP